MIIRLYLVLLYLFCVNSNNGDKASEEEASRKRILDQLTKTRTFLLDDYHLVSRQIATDVYAYRSYRTVSVIFYPMMRDITDARFMFQAEELHLNAIGSCEPQEVIIQIKHGSYPAVNPDGYAFPKYFIEQTAREDIHTIELKSDGQNNTFLLKNPRPGNWYALAYIKWEDPRTQKVEQQGLVAVCQTYIYTDLQVKKADDIQLVDCYSGLTWSYSDVPFKLKCMSVDDNEALNLNLTIVNTDINSSKISFKLNSLSLPQEDDHIIYCAFDPRESNVQLITFFPQPSSWHYIELDYVSENYSSIADCASYSYNLDGIDNHSIQELMRDNKGQFFTFDYGLATTDLQDATSLINITADEIKSVRFEVNQFLDIGGTISIETSLLMSLQYYMGYKRELKDTLLAFTEDNQFFRVVVCMDIGHASVPDAAGICKYNDKTKPALFVLNSTDSDSIHGKIIIPYPESGTWYLTFRLFCDQVVCPCRTSDNGTKYYVDAYSRTNYSDVGSLANNTREGESECNATVVLSITSGTCVSGRCSGHGSCLLNTFGGLVMSFCSCATGYGGWDCSDDSRMDSHTYMLISVLLLTLSNLLFIVSIYIAVIRQYYTEAMMYTFTMVFSTFYHACDAPSQVAYCIIRGNILQFGDFYCGLMSFWLTLLAMSILNDRVKSSFQLSGATVVALLTTWNMHSFLAFFLPVAVGVFVLFLSWYVDYRKVRTMRYPRSYYTRYLPLGIVLVSVGLICYAFLQTEQNYKIVHSFWHMIVASCVVFLLPDVKRGEGVNPFLPTPNNCRLPFCHIFKRTRIAND